MAEWAVMSEIDDTIEDKRADLNKTILDAANSTLCKYVVKQSELDDPLLDDIDRVIKISNHFSGRVLLDDGKNTANLGLNAGAAGFNVTFIETVAGTATVDDDVDDDVDDGDTLTNEDIE